MQSILKQEKTYLEELWKRIEEKLGITSERLQDSLPYTTVAGRYNDCDPKDRSWWTNTFWAGILWHLYEETKQEKYRTWARSIEEKMDIVVFQYDDLHHDVGFMWLLCSVMDHEATGDTQARRRALLAASVLSSRYNLAGGYIRAWNGNNNGWAIIDCMMNIPLLFWASEQSRDDRFKHVALAHADKTMEHFVRPDGSVNHIVSFDERTGQFLEAPRGQGFANGSAWSRGQAWAVYGFAQSYNWTGNLKYLDTAKRVAHFVLAQLAQTGYVPPCDYRQPSDSLLVDSSAGAITACGLIEIAKSVPETEKAFYLGGALRILKALDLNCAVWDLRDEALLSQGTSQFHLDPKGRWEVSNGSLIYGDFYFVEAVCKLRALIG